MSSWRSERGLQWQPVKLWWTPCSRGLRLCWKILVATQNTDTLGPETHGACDKPFRTSLTKPPPQAFDADNTSLPDALDHFYSRFETQNYTHAQKLLTPPNDQALCLSPADVRKTISKINPRKAVGPDNIPGRALKDCAEQLTDVLTDIFNTSLSQAVIPTFFKSTTIAVPKKSPVSCLNDYRPITLTPIIMILPSGWLYRSIKARSARLLYSFFPQAVRALNSNPPDPLWNPIQTTDLLKHGPSHNPPPQPYHITGKNCQFFFCAIQSVLHRWVGLYKPPVETHFPHTTVCT